MKHVSRDKAYAAARWKPFGEWLRAYKSGKPCVDCPPDVRWPPEALDFDHVQGEKTCSVSSMSPIRGYSRDDVLAEIAKCELRCRNHHAIKTYRLREMKNKRKSSTMAPAALELVPPIDPQMKLFQ